MKKTICIFLIMLLLCGCKSVSKTYEFPYPLEDVESIELIINKNGSGEAYLSKLIVIKTLSEEEIQSFMTEIYALKTVRSNPPGWGWGEYIAKVTYENGFIEMLGSYNISTAEKGEELLSGGWYHFLDDFEGVFLRYAD